MSWVAPAARSSSANFKRSCPSPWSHPAPSAHGPLQSQEAHSQPAKVKMNHAVPGRFGWDVVQILPVGWVIPVWFTQVALAHAWFEPLEQDLVARHETQLLCLVLFADLVPASIRAPRTVIGGINNLKNKINSCYQSHEASCPTQQWSLILYLILEAETKCFNFILFST